MACFASVRTLVVIKLCDSRSEIFYLLFINKRKIYTKFMSRDTYCLYNTSERISDAFLRTCVVDRIEEFRVEPGQHLNIPDVRATSVGKGETLARLDATEYRRFAITDFGFMGIVPDGARVGDKVVAFAGAGVLFVLRDLDDCHILVGECYIHGYMSGEVCEFVEHGWPGSDGQSMRWTDFGIR